jgi:hypothetical protein
MSSPSKAFVSRLRAPSSRVSGGDADDQVPTLAESASAKELDVAGG